MSDKLNDATCDKLAASFNDASNQEILVKGMKLWMDIREADDRHKAKFMEDLFRANNV